MNYGPRRERWWKALQRLTCRTFACGTPPSKTKLQFNIDGAVVTVITDRKDRWTMNIDSEQKITATVKGLTRKGNPAPLESARFVVDPEGVVTITNEEGPLSGTFTPVAGQAFPATVQITCVADAQPGEGEREIVAVGSLTIVPAGAQIAELSFGEPQDA